MVKRKKPLEEWQAKLGTSALDPMQAMDLQEAIRKRKKRANLDGRWFLIKYLSDGETIHYSPEEGFVPTGYLNIRKFVEGR